MGLSKNLRRIMEERQLSVAQLSQKSGIPAKTLYHWLSGQQPQKIEYLFKICDVLNISIEELYGRKSKTKEGTVPSPQDLFHIGVYEVILRPIPSTNKEN